MTNSVTAKLEKEQAVINTITDVVEKQQQQNNIDAKKLLADVVPLFNTNAQVKSADDLKKPEVKAQVMLEIEEKLNVGQGNLFASQIAAEAEAIYNTFVSDYKNNTIDIPRMVLMSDKTTSGFDDFDLNANDFSYAQIENEIIRTGLIDHSVDTIAAKQGAYRGSPEDLLISELVNFPNIDYDTNSDLLHKLAGQATDALKKNLIGNENINTVVFQWRKLIAKKIQEQMEPYFWLHEAAYTAPQVLSFTQIEPWNFTAIANEVAKDFRDDSFPASQTNKYIFRGFAKSCHPAYKFDSRTEQTLAYILENDRSIIKWLRPAPDQFRIYWSHNSKIYEPDFVAETETGIYLIETKRADETNSDHVQAKSQAALKYCHYATEYTTRNGGKPWQYVLIPHDQVSRTSSFQGVVAPNILK